MSLVILMVEKLLEHFAKNNCRKQKKKKNEFRVEKVIKRKGNKLYVKWNPIIILLTVGLIKKILLYKISYFPEPYTCSKSKVKVELDLSNFTTKSNL